VAAPFQQREFNMSFLAKLNNALDDGLLKVVFTHIRNYVLCMTIMAAGFFALEAEHELFPGLLDEFAGVLAVVFGLLLAMLNLYEAIYRLSKNKFHTILNIILVVLYIIITGRIFEVIWHFRSAM
jgi:membrane-bound ClpP family serine protease